MVNSELRDILHCCLSMDRAAADFYRKMAGQTQDAAHKAFWEDIAGDETRHLAYWDRLLAREEKAEISNPFDRPQEIRSEFMGMRRRLGEMLAEQDAPSDMRKPILFALRLEALMLHPAFSILFDGLEQETGEVAPGRDYQAHIDKFLEFVRENFEKKPELVFIAELLSGTYRRSSELARHIREIRTLRGLVPICANCKNIRDDRGYWERIESYLARHGDIKFTHGICPECERKLYPEFFQDKA